MKTHKGKSINSILIFTFLVAFFYCINIEAQIQDSLHYIETQRINETIWHVKALGPDSELINIKAIDKNGKIHDVKAIQDSDDTSILDVKALVNGKRLPIKLLVNEYDSYVPVKAIDEDGTIIDIKGITKTGQILDVKAVSKSGNIINIRAITKKGDRYKIIAISPSGIKNDVKGIKMLKSKVETTIGGVAIFAHVKSTTHVKSTIKLKD